MSPRYSILNLIVLTGYTAVTIGGLLDPVGAGLPALLAIWIAAVMMFASRAVGPASSRRAFARGFLAVCLACTSAAMLLHNPDQAILYRLGECGLIAPVADHDDRALGYARLSMAHGSLALGCLGGYAAQWQSSAAEPRGDRAA